MIRVKNLLENDDVTKTESGGPFQIIEWKRDLSVTPADAQLKLFMSEMGMKKRQLVCTLKNDAIILQAGAMQWMGGSIEQTTGVKGAGDLMKKAFAGKATGESAIKPEYRGTGVLVTEPTYRHLLVEDVANWSGGMVVQDGLFLAAQASVRMRTVARNNMSSAIAGGEGLFNLCMDGAGFAVLECMVPREELITLTLENDSVKIDGAYAIAWDNSLQFTVERSGRSLIGSAASGEGLVNVYRGTGHILMMPEM